jgi:CBS-domain-containing membrane protein
MADAAPITPEPATPIADAVDDIEQNIIHLEELQDLSREEHQAGETQLQRNAVERKFEKLIAAVINIAGTVLRAEYLTVLTIERPRLLSSANWKSLTAISKKDWRLQLAFEISSLIHTARSSMMISCTMLSRVSLRDVYSS